VLAVNPVIKHEKLPDVEPLVVLLSLVVGVAPVLQQIPLTVIVPPPSEVIVPPHDADVCVKLPTLEVVMVGAVTVVVLLLLLLLLSFLQLYESINKAPIAINDKIPIEVLMFFINISFNYSDNK
jgi:hypothetical protein